MGNLYTAIFTQTSLASCLTTLKTKGKSPWLTLHSLWWEGGERKKKKSSILVTETNHWGVHITAL